MILSGNFLICGKCNYAETKEGVVNAVSNLRRALDCEMDMFLKAWK